MRVIRGNLSNDRRDLLIRAFQRIDSRGAGAVLMEDFISVFNPQKHPSVVEGRKTSDQVLGEFLETFDIHHNVLQNKSKDPTVDLQEFLEYYTYVSSQIDDDVYF